LAYQTSEFVHVIISGAVNTPDNVSPEGAVKYMAFPKIYPLNDLAIGIIFLDDSLTYTIILSVNLL
jgi:hypothetical protein